MSDVLKTRRIAKTVLSTGFIIVSGSYAFWYHHIRLDAVAPAPKFQVAPRPLPQHLPLPPNASLSPHMADTAPLTLRATPESMPLSRPGSNIAASPALTKAPPHSPTSEVQAAVADNVPAETLPPACTPSEPMRQKWGYS